MSGPCGVQKGRNRLFHSGGLPVGRGSELGLRQRLRVPGSLSESDRERGEGTVLWTRSRGGLGAFSLGD